MQWLQNQLVVLDELRNASREVADSSDTPNHVSELTEKIVQHLPDCPKEDIFLSRTHCISVWLEDRPRWQRRWFTEDTSILRNSSLFELSKKLQCVSRDSHVVHLEKPSWGSSDGCLLNSKRRRETKVANGERHQKTRNDDDRSCKREIRTSYS